MKLSLKAKFYIYILPLLILFPVILYSLIAPYTQLRQSFGQFQQDANRAQEAESFAEALNTEQLELFHFIEAVPTVSYDVTANSNYADFNNASLSATAQLQKITSQVHQSANPNDEEYISVDNINEYY